MKIKYKVPSDKYISVEVCFLFALQKYRLVLCNHCVATRARMCIFTGVVLNLWGDTFFNARKNLKEAKMDESIIAFIAFEEVALPVGIPFIVSRWARRYSYNQL